MGVKGWHCVEAGWHLKVGVGVIKRWPSGWYFYPDTGRSPYQIGPYTTLAKAKEGGNPDA